MEKAPLPRYVLITPARNEASLIEGTIRSVVAQTHLPLRWYIVSDGSTDGTDDIVRRHAGLHPWIVPMRMPEREARTFAGKAGCFNAAWQAAKDLPYDVIGNLDADVTFEPDFFAFLISRFAEDPALGVAGAPFVEEGFSSYGHSHANFEHVSGACQLFRRGCFDEIGGYTPIDGGGIDWVAVTTARMKGWKTRTFPDKTFFHHRKIGSVAGGPLRARFNHGMKDQYLGGHPLWQVSRAIFQMRSKPYIVGGLSLLLGYCWSAARSGRCPVPPDLVRFHRKEQMARLRRSLTPRAAGAAPDGRGAKKI
jgi:poly-beta-1,6-N-acetyl-D-glucosamine synthase